MNRYNRETLLKLIILVTLSIIYIRFIVTGDLLKIMHPRLLPFVKFSIMLMIIVSISLLISIGKNRTKPAYLSSYKLFILPLLVVLFFDPSKDIVSTKTIDSNYSNNNKESLLTDNVIDEDNSQYNNEVIVINDENYLSLRDKIFNDIDSCNNRKVQVIGFIYKDESIKENQFVIARYVMSCCASDMQITGFLCKDNKQYNENSWYKITGTLKKNNDNKLLDSIYIDVEKAEAIEVPIKQYIYP